MNPFSGWNKQFARAGIRFWLGAFLIFSSGAQSIASAPPSFLVTEWHSDHGLPHDSVQAIVQSRDGYLWVGTRKGLTRFDGMRFTMVGVSSAKENISSLLEDRAGNLWVGAAKGIVRINHGVVMEYGPEQGAIRDDIRTIFEAKDGSIWFGRSTGLTQFKDGKFFHFTRNEGLPSNVVRSICEDDAGNLWIATDAGMCSRKDGVMQPLWVPEELAGGVRVVYFDPQKKFWAGTQSGLFLRKADGWEHFDKKKNGLADDFVDALHYDRTGQLWIGTYSGLSRLVNGKFITELTSEGTPYDLVNCICEDREGNFWIGSKEGLARLKPRPFTGITKQQGLTHNNVMSVLEDKTGAFWCGTWGGGVFQLKDDKVTALTNQLGNNRILSVCERKDGSLWFGADFDSGLFRYKDGKLTHFNETNGLEKIGIRIIYEDRAENLWIGTSRSLAVLKDGRFVHFTPKDGLAGESVREIFEDRAGNLWIGTATGLSRWKDGKFTNFTTENGLAHNAIFALHEDAENNLWIGTGGGLCRLQDAKFSNYTTRNGLFNDEILEILEDDQGDLWMGCLKGIFRVSKSALDKFDRGEITDIPCAAYGKDDGMISVICSNVAKPAGWKARDGRLWFATSKGLVVAGPHIKVNDTPPSIVIENVIADKKRINESVNQRVREGSATHSFSDSLIHKLPPGRGELEIHYTALSFQAPERNRFKYKLEGVDPDWVEADTRRVAYYNNIAPGDYIFRVIGCNNNGVWNESGAKVKLTWQPHYWQTWWFKSFVAIASLSMAASAARYVTTKRMRLKLERLKQQHAIERERARIAKDIHDDLGASLTRITFLGELAEADKAKPESVENYVHGIVATARDTVRSLDEIVWAVNPRRDTLNSFVEYVVHFADEFLEKTNLGCRLDLPDSIPDIPLSSEVRHNLFLIVKEFLNNSVKHAHATEISIRMRLEEEKFTMEIIDDGVGFDLMKRAEKRQGNGLENMRKRAENLGGALKLEAEAGKGTRLWFQVELSRLVSPSYEAGVVG